MHMLLCKIITNRIDLFTAEIMGKMLTSPGEKICMIFIVTTEALLVVWKLYLSTRAVCVSGFQNGLINNNNFLVLFRISLY